LTLRLGLFGVLGSLLLGGVVELVKYYKVPGLKAFFKLYFELSRNTPLIVQLFFLFYALPKIGVVISAETCAIVGLIFLGGSYMSAALASGISEISCGEIEGARALGLNRWQVLSILIAPQGVKMALPGIFANLVFLIKETSVFSAIAVLDLMAVAKGVIGSTYDTNESLLLLVVSYAVILTPFVVLYYVLHKYVQKTNIANKGGVA
jgi:polar amino acid transport system permease protein